MRSDGRDNRRRLAGVIGFNAGWKTLTTNTLTWAMISKRKGMSRATVGFHEAGLIGRVTAKRSASAKLVAGWKGDDAFLNDVSGYALTQPVDELVVDVSGTPHTVNGYKEFPARAHETGTPPGPATRPSPTKAADGRPNTIPAHAELAIL